MSKTTNSLKIALGAAVVTGMGVAGVANADAGEDIFAMEELSSGYLTAGGHEGSCGEGKCGGDKKDGEGSCGGDKKDGEGKCGEGKCGGGIA